MRHIETKQEFYALSRKLLLGNILRQWTWTGFCRQLEKRDLSEPHDLPANGVVGVRHVRQAFTNKGNSGLMRLEEAFQYGIKTPDKHNLLFDEGAVHDRLTIQGEVMADERGLYVRYSHLQCHQRTLWHIAQHGVKGLKSYQLPHNLDTLTTRQKRGLDNHVVLHARGLQASALLQKYMDVDSWDVLSNIVSCQHDNFKGSLAIQRCPFLFPWEKEGLRRTGNTYGDKLLNFVHPIVEFACFDRPIGVLGWNTLFWEVRTKY